MGVNDPSVHVVQNMVNQAYGEMRELRRQNDAALELTTEKEGEGERAWFGFVGSRCYS
jgi:hypothetical protein